jgi:hypothetical protein
MYRKIKREVEMEMAVFRDTAEDGGSMFLRNVDICLQSHKFKNSGDHNEHF